MIHNELLSSACERLSGRFPGCRVYREKVPQGFERPAFSVRAGLSGHKKTLPGRAWREYSFEISFFPGKDGGPSADEAAEALCELFGQLGEAGRPVRCGAVRTRVEDGALKAEFSVSAAAKWVKDGQDGELMGELSRLEIGGKAT